MTTSCLPNCSYSRVLLMLWIASVLLTAIHFKNIQWIKKQLPWKERLTNEEAISVIPLQHFPPNESSSSSVPLLVGGKEIKWGSQPKKENMTLLGQGMEAVKKATAKLESNTTIMPSTISKNASPSKRSDGSNGGASGQLPQTFKISSSTEGIQNSIGTFNSTQQTKTVTLSQVKSLCPPVPPKLVGVLKIHRTVPSLKEQEKSHPELELGGRFQPAECRARHRVAIIVPYRDREKHLAIFTYHLHPILQRQQIEYAIYIVEQAGTKNFNRAKLMNIGALEALKKYPYDCFVFHDIDLLPEDDRNLYTCPEQPRHMSIAVDILNYRLPYNNIFGGVSAMTVEQFKKVNGFSNEFWGWGGEDDDLSNRVRFYGYTISRYPEKIGRYTMLSHKRANANPKRIDLLYSGQKRFKTDGINSIKYKVLDVQLRRLYTWLYVDVSPS